MGLSHPSTPTSSSQALGKTPMYPLLPEQLSLCEMSPAWGQLQSKAALVGGSIDLWGQSVLYCGALLCLAG